MRAEGDARELGLDMGAFERCVESKQFAAAVQQDLEQRARRRSSLPLDAFVQVIDDELQRASAKQ